jgi:hypothetical protein
MEPKCSPLHSHAPTTCSYPKPDQSSACPPPPFQFLTIYFKIILASMPGSSKQSPSIRSPHQNTTCTSPLPHTYHMPHPFHSSWFDHLNNIWWGTEVHTVTFVCGYYAVPPLCCNFSFLCVPFCFLVTPVTDTSTRAHFHNFSTPSKLGPYVSCVFVYQTRKRPIIYFSHEEDTQIWFL